MKKKVFASDFDGTLYFYKADVKLPPESVEKIKEYQAAGHLFGLCTGRQVGGLTPFIGGIVSPDFYITSSGANIVDRDLQPLLDASDVSYTFPYAPEEVQRRATKVVPTIVDALNDSMNDGR